MTRWFSDASALTRARDRDRQLRHLDRACSTSTDGENLDIDGLVQDRARLRSRGDEGLRGRDEARHLRRRQGRPDRGRRDRPARRPRHAHVLRARRRRRRAASARRSPTRSSRRRSSRRSSSTPPATSGSTRRSRRTSTGRTRSRRGSSSSRTSTRSSAPTSRSIYPGAPDRGARLRARARRVISQAGQVVLAARRRPTTSAAT